MIQARTLEEAKLQNDEEFQLLIDELHAFVNLCIIGGVITDRDSRFIVFGILTTVGEFLWKQGHETIEIHSI